jgi:hypothetical protein
VFVKPEGGWKAMTETAKLSVSDELASSFGRSTAEQCSLGAMQRTITSNLFIANLLFDFKSGHSGYIHLARRGTVK